MNLLQTSSGISSPDRPVLFIQPFSVGHMTGGSRILRSVIEAAPVKVASICTGFCKTLEPNALCDEQLERFRPPLGRLDRTRFAHLGGWVEFLCSPLFRKRLKARVSKINPRAIHLVPHSWGDFAVAHRVADELGIPVHASFHDDFAYTACGHPLKSRLLRQLGELWRNSETRFVICDELGAEYSRRYGQRDYLLHTDGTEVVHSKMAISSSCKDPTMYFMGMMNQPYVANVRKAAEALRVLEKISGGCPQFTLRTHGYLPEQGELTKVMPFAPESVVCEELRNHDLLYLPLPFGKEYEGLWKYGFSTKMVSYLASGTPILYHGPLEAAAGQYLAKNEAAICLHTMEPDVMASTMLEALNDREKLRKLSENASRIATRDFDATMLRERFWGAVLKAI